MYTQLGVRIGIRVIKKKELIIDVVTKMRIKLTINEEVKINK